MTAKEFFDLVRRMRAAQREYFNFKQPDVLRLSKKLENEVDAEISRVDLVMMEKRQPRMF